MLIKVCTCFINYINENEYIMTRSRHPNQIIVLIIIYIAFISLGLPDALLGSSWNLMRVDLEQQLSMVGLITATSYALTLTSTFLSPKLLAFFQTKVIVFISIIFTGSAVILISQVSNFWVLVFLTIPLGIGAGAIDLSLNHYVSIHYKASHMSYLHGFYGIGVTTGPLIMAKVLEYNTWRIGYMIVGIILLIIAFLVLITFPYWFKESTEHQEEYHGNYSVKEVFLTKGVIPSILIFMFYVHIESFLSVFVASYMHLVKGFNLSQSALATMVYFLALTAGRFTSGFISNRFKSQMIIKLSELLIILGAILLIINVSNAYLSFLFIFLIGFGSGPIYPNMMHLNSKFFENQKISRVMSLQMMIGYLGFGALTPLMGIILDKVSINLYPFIIILLGTCLFLITSYYLKIKNEN